MFKINFWAVPALSLELPVRNSGPTITSILKSAYFATGEFSLQTIMLLSALESWSFSNQVRLPDYLHEQLADVVEHLRKKVLHE